MAALLSGMEVEDVSFCATVRPPGSTKEFFLGGAGKLHNYLFVLKSLIVVISFIEVFLETLNQGAITVTLAATQ